MKINLFRLGASIVIPFLAAAIGSVFTYQNIPTWYASLNKPFFTPPNWLFGPAWTTLYILMGISLYFVWNKCIKGKKEKLALYLFAAQLALNALWSILFFGLHSPLLGFMCIVPLWLAITATIWKFYGIDKRAAYAMVPYIMWVSFAATLNFAVWMLNP